MVGRLSTSTKMDPIGSDRVQKKGVNWIGNLEKWGQLD